jgi:hypothetical protein
MNPIVDPEVATKKLLLNAYVPGEEDEFIKKQTPVDPLQQQVEQAGMQQNKKTAVTQITTPTPEMELA